MADYGRRRVRCARGYFIPATVDREAEAASLRAGAVKLDALSDIDEADVNEMVQEFEKLRKTERRGDAQ